MLTLTQGKKLVKLARKSITSWFKKQQLNFTTEKREFKDLQGTFVTLHTYPKKELRGCIGFPMPTTPLAEAIFQAARSAAFSDPRFDPIEEKDLKKVVIEVSVLTRPQKIQATGNLIPHQVKIGEDGLIIIYMGHSGLLLPQVATELKLDPSMFLSAACQKAGLPGNAWVNPQCQVLKFQAQIFSETKPAGPIKEKGKKTVKTKPKKTTKKRVKTEKKVTKKKKK